jgi:N-dimethylarginine dimethylaminohydrolase
MTFGVTSNSGRLVRVAVKSPRVGWQTTGRVAVQWRRLNYTALPDLDNAIAQHDELVRHLRDSGCLVEDMPAHASTGLDSVYVHDPVVMAGTGAILLRLGKPARRGEDEAFGEWFAQAGVPVIGRINPPGTLEGGDVVWLDSRTVAVGEGYRSNAAGIAQLRAILSSAVDHVIAVPLPHWTGPTDCLHLMSLLSPVDAKAAVVYSRLLPVPFREYLVERGWRLIEVPDEEYDAMACNVLPVGPMDVIMLDGCPVTRSRLESAGAKVRTYPGSDISLKGGGGPTCLTRPILRDGMTE